MKEDRLQQDKQRENQQRRREGLTTFDLQNNLNLMSL